MKTRPLSSLELEHIRATYRVAKHTILGHVYRDLMKLLDEVDRLKALVGEKESLEPLTDQVE